MITLIPAFFLIISGIAVIILSSVRKGLGLPWLISSISALLAWGGLIALHWLAPNPIYLIGWNPVESFTNLIGFQLDLISWPYSFALVTLTMAVLFTSSARIESTVPSIWGINLIFGGLGVFAMMAVTPLTLILVWSVIDLGEFIVLQQTIKHSGYIRKIVLSYGIQLVSIFLVSIAMIISRSKGLVLEFSQLTNSAAIVLLLSAVLRLGIFPRHAPYPAKFRFRRDFGSLMSGIQPATGLVLLARISDLGLSDNWLNLFRIFIVVIVIYGSIRWMMSANEGERRPFWIISTAGLAILSVLNGQQITSLIWGLILILIGGVSGLYTCRDAKIQYIPVLAILGILGLPYTPAAGGWVGLANSSFSIFTIFYFVIHIILVLGLIRHLFHEEESYENLDRWVKVIYPAGLLLLIIAQWIIATWGWTGSYTAGVIWAGFIPVGIISAGYFVWFYTPLFKNNQEKLLRYKYLSRKYFLKPVSEILNGRWLLDLLNIMLELIGQFVRTISRLLEGEGGFFWVLLLLTILVTFVMSTGG